MVGTGVRDSGAAGEPADVLWSIRDDRVLTGAVTAAVVHLPDADCGSLALVDGSGPWTVAASAPQARRLDGLQYLLAEGPGLDAVSADRVVACTDLAGARDWPEFAPRAVQTGARAALAVPLPIESGSGVLTVYAERPGAFGAGVPDLAVAVAAEAAVAVTGARRMANLLVALRSRDVLGQAKGILMERYKITADQAFDLLSQLSQDRNVKVRELAEDLAVTGELPPPD